MNGYRMRNRTGEGATFLPPSNLKDVPDSVDWRPKGYVTPIKNQVSPSALLTQSLHDTVDWRPHG